MMPCRGRRSSGRAGKPDLPGARLMYRIGVLSLVLFISSLPAQTGEVAPGANLVVEGIPRIPATLAEKVGRYTEFRQAHLADWHPKERELLITTRFGDTTQVHHVKFPGAARTQLTFFPDSVAAARFPPTHDDYLLFSKAKGG